MVKDLVAIIIMVVIDRLNLSFLFKKTFINSSIVS